jgi:tRNA nucleotidyltransferase (CCA-adding enzyme)
MELVGALRARAAALEIEARAPRPIILGRHLVAMGMQPGPDFRPILDSAFEAQLEGVFCDEPGGLAWLRERVK